jgi:hypothetical protein
MKNSAGQMRQTARALFQHAADARALSSTFRDRTTVEDLDAFAAALENDAHELERDSGLFVGTMKRQAR